MAEKTVSDRSQGTGEIVNCEQMTYATALEQFDTKYSEREDSISADRPVWVVAAVGDYEAGHPQGAMVHLSGAKFLIDGYSGFLITTGLGYEELGYKG